LTDVIMPEMNGAALADHIRPLCPGLRVLFMSGYTDDTIIRHGVLEAGVSLLPKPFTPSGLLSKVRETLERPSPGAVA
jgi:CheY-like chemotaxis protein